MRRRSNTCYSIANMKKKYVSVIDLTHYLSMSKSKIYEMVNGGQIPYYRICGTIRFNIEEIEQWISSGGYFDKEEVSLPRI